jgi:hypothetical protein
MEDKIKEIGFDFDEYKPTTFEKIKWWIKDARFYPSEFMSGVKNLWKWFPVIWKDRDWDHNYIFEVLKFKISNQSNYIGGHDRHTTAKRDAEIMMTVTRLIDKVQEDTYSMEYMDYHKTKYFFEELDEKRNDEKLYEWKSDLKSENFDEFFKKYPRQYKKAVSGELSRFTRYDDEAKNKQIYAMEIAHENQERCHRLLFKILANNIRKWWD